jgi:hypothetical protein
MTVRSGAQCSTLPRSIAYSTGDRGPKDEGASLLLALGYSSP